MNSKLVVWLLLCLTNFAIPSARAAGGFNLEVYFCPVGSAAYQVFEDGPVVTPEDGAAWRQRLLAARGVKLLDRQVLNFSSFTEGTISSTVAGREFTYAVQADLLPAGYYSVHLGFRTVRNGPTRKGMPSRRAINSVSATGFNLQPNHVRIPLTATTINPDDPTENIDGALVVFAVGR